MIIAAGRAAALQLSSVAAGACAAVCAKFFLTSLSVAQFLFIFSVTSVVLCIPLVDRTSLRLFFTGTIGWLAIASNTAGLIVFYIGLAGLDPGTHAFLSRTHVLFGFVLSYFLFQEPFGVGRLTLAVLCVFSVLLIAAPSHLNTDQSHAALATIAAAGFYAINYALLRMLPTAVSPSTPIVIYNITLIPLTLSHVDIPNTIETITLVDFSIAFASTILSILSLYLYLLSARHVSFFVSVSLRAFSPVFVALLALPWFPMQLSRENLVGVLSMPCVLLMISVMESRSSRQQPVP